MPFALNEATRFISPTKVLEYMAAELPVVSTAITDVEQPLRRHRRHRPHRRGIHRRLRSGAGHDSERRPSHGQAHARDRRRTSWDKTAERMRD
jgi:UDP-galactopyranose mutase